MSSLDQKKAAIKKSREYMRANAKKVRFDPNIPVLVIFPADWYNQMTQETRESRDKDGDDYAVTIYKVHNPNADDPEKMQVLEASEKLNAEITTVLEESNEEGWDGPIEMKIIKKVTGGNPYGQWSVQGQKYEGQEPQGGKK